MNEAIPGCWADDHANTVRGVTGIGLPECLNAGVLCRDVDVEGRVILGNPLPDVLDTFPLRAVEARRDPIKVKGRRDNVQSAGVQDVPGRPGRNVAIKIEIYDLGGSGAAVK